MQGYITSSGDLYLMRYLMTQRMENPGLQWEKTQSWNFALDFGFLNDRITGTLEYYRMSTKDMIMGQRLPNFTGFESITTNLGQVDNNGLEIALNTLNIDNRISNGAQHLASHTIRTVLNIYMVIMKIYGRFRQCDW